MKYKRILLIILSALLASTTLLNTVSNLSSNLENRLTGLFFRLRGTQAVSKTPLVLIAIDEKSTQHYGQKHPTPRKLLADIVHQLHLKKAKVIALDIILDKTHAPEDDRLLIQALQEAKGTVVLASRSHPKNDEKILPKFLEGNYQGFSVGFGEEKVRWIKVGSENGKQSFTSEVFRLYKGTYPEIDGIQINENNEKLVYINYVGEPMRITDEFPRFPFFSALELDQVPKEIIAGKIVLVGSTIGSLQDDFLTPFSTSQNNYLPSFGIDINATVLNMFFSQEFIITLPSYLNGILMFFTLAGWSLLLLFTRPVMSPLLLIFIIIFVLVLSAFLFIYANIIFNCINLILFLILLFFVAQVMNILSFANHSKKLESELGSAVSDITRKDETIFTVRQALQNRERELEKSAAFKHEVLSHFNSPKNKKSSLLEIATVLDEVLFIESDGNNCFVTTQKNTKYVTNISLIKVEKAFEGFLLRVHRKYLVNPQNCSRLEKYGRHYSVCFESNVIPVSQTYLDKTKEYFGARN